MDQVLVISTTHSGTASSCSSIVQCISPSKHQTTSPLLTLTTKTTLICRNGPLMSRPVNYHRSSQARQRKWEGSQAQPLSRRKYGRGRRSRKTGPSKRRKRQVTPTEGTPPLPDQEIPFDLPSSVRQPAADTPLPTPNPIPAAQADLPLLLRQAKSEIRELEAQLRDQQELAYEGEEDLRYQLRQQATDLTSEFQVRADELEGRILQLEQQNEQLITHIRLLESSDIDTLPHAVARTRSDSTCSAVKLQRLRWSFAVWQKMEYISLEKPQKKITCLSLSLTGLGYCVLLKSSFFATRVELSFRHLCSNRIWPRSSSQFDSGHLIPFSLVQPVQPL